jgi:hypothetical protein
MTEELFRAPTASNDVDFSPIEPEIDDGSACRDIFARAYVEPSGFKRRAVKEQPRELPSLDGFVLIFDVETVEHALTFGVAELHEKRRRKKRVVFYNEDLRTSDPAGYDRLKEICRTLDVKLVPREWLFQNGIWLARNLGWAVAGANVAYDLSHIADSFEPATKSARFGTRFCNGFALRHHFVSLQGLQAPVFCRIKRDDRHHVRYDMKKAAVVDVLTVASAHTDRNHALMDPPGTPPDQRTSACHAFGVPFEDRPGSHSGEITIENVEGCLYDVDRTAALLWALDREQARHPIALHLSQAQTGAAIAKAYLDALGVRPRSDVQPDFIKLKPYLGYAAQAYFGGRVEARIVKTPLPCVYLDFLSMYPTVFSLLGLWWKHVTPATVVVDEIPPREISELLARLREHPDDLFDPEKWKALDFFALVWPNGATLPARVDIPTGGLSRRERIAYEAARLYEEASIAQAPFWNALDACGRKIVPDMLFEPKRKRWQRAGEFADVPRRILGKNHKRPQSGETFGNIDDIAQHVRDALNNQDLTTSDVLSFFATHERPTRARARAEARRSIGLGDDEQAASDSSVTIGSIIESKMPLWYAGPDLAAAAIRGGAPQIIRAWRLRPVGMLGSLKPILFRGADRIDPRTDDFYTRLIELRKAETGDALDDERRSTGYKVVANSGAYGVSAETSPIDIDPDDKTRKPHRVAVYEAKQYDKLVDRPERHGRWNFFPTASLVTAGSRLMLDLAIREVERRRGEVLYDDTDGLIVASSKEGGFAPCEGGKYQLPDGMRAARALPWSEVEAIRERFSSLNPYDRSVLPGSVLKLEDENFLDKKREERCPLWCYAVSEKSYALFNLDERGEPVIRKYSTFVLGQYRSPIPGDREGRWIQAAWTREIRTAVGKPVEAFSWEQYPAIAPLTLSTWNALSPYRDNAGPFDFVAAAMVSHKLLDIAARPYACCMEPRPACMPFSNAADWQAQEWRCLRCEEPWDFERFPRFLTYGEIVTATLQHVERKRLCADGSEQSTTSRGLTIPRPVRVETKKPIGKERPVDPTDTTEGLTFEQLDATNVLVYTDSAERLVELRAEIVAEGVAAFVARTPEVSRSQIYAFVNEGTTPRKSTIEKLEAALR